MIKYLLALCCISCCAFCDSFEDELLRLQVRYSDSLSKLEETVFIEDKDFYDGKLDFAYVLGRKQLIDCLIIEYRNLNQQAKHPE